MVSENTHHPKCRKAHQLTSQEFKAPLAARFSVGPPVSSLPPTVGACHLLHPELPRKPTPVLPPPAETRMKLPKHVRSAPQ